MSGVQYPTFSQYAVTDSPPSVSDLANAAPVKSVSGSFVVTATSTATNAVLVTDNVGNPIALPAGAFLQSLIVRQSSSAATMASLVAVPNLATTGAGLLAGDTPFGASIGFADANTGSQQILTTTNATPVLAATRWVTMDVTAAATVDLTPVKVTITYV